MSGEREGEGERLAGFIADGLHDSGVLGATDIQRATAIAAEEIAVSKAMGAYWCSWCCLKPEAAAGVQANDEAISFAADGENHTATLRNVTNDAAIELTLSPPSATGHYLFRTQKPNGVSAELSGSFIADTAILDTLARELSSLVHDSWSFLLIRGPP